MRTSLTKQDTSKMKLIYLASPYSDPDKFVQEERFRAACLAAGRFLAAGIWVFSPIAHTHPIATLVQLPGGWDYWNTYDTIMVSRCDALCVLTIDGWRESKGVQAEIAIAKRLGKPLMYVGPGEEPFNKCMVEAMGGTLWGEQKTQPLKMKRQKLKTERIVLRPSSNESKIIEQPVTRRAKSLI